MTPSAQLAVLGLVAQISFRKGRIGTTHLFTMSSRVVGITQAELLEGLILNFPATESQQVPPVNVQS